MSNGRNYDKFKQKNIFSNTNLTEGNKIYQAKIETNKDTLNQESCICDHSDTNRIFLPKTSSFKPLGKKVKNLN